MPGWGSGGYGGSPWGLGSGGPLFAVSALVTSERTVVVELSDTPRANSPVGDGDALNPNTWYVDVLDSDGNVERSLLVLAVRLYSGTTQFELYTLDKFEPSTITHRVGSDTLVDPGGVLITLPKYVDFLGCVAAQIPAANRGLVDVANPQTGAMDEGGGTLIVGSDGDYANESGIDLYRKLIIRRLTTTPGDFFYFDPTYGLGLRVKEPLGISDIPKLKAEVERQLKREPEFAAVQASITITPNGVMTITVRVQLTASGALLAIPIQVPTSLVQL